MGALQSLAHTSLYVSFCQPMGLNPILLKRLPVCENQTYSDFEVLVVDDASPDQSVAIAQRFADQMSVFVLFTIRTTRAFRRRVIQGSLLLRGAILSFFVLMTRMTIAFGKGSGVA